MTAEEFLKDAQQNPEKGWTAKKILIEFAKYHVEQALQKAYENADLEYYGDEVCYNKDSIVNAYPLENIK